MNKWNLLMVVLTCFALDLSAAVVKVNSSELLAAYTATVWTNTHNGIVVQSNDMVVIQIASNKKITVADFTVAITGGSASLQTMTKVSNSSVTKSASHVFYANVVSAGTVDVQITASGSSTARSATYVLRADTGSIGIGDTLIIEGETVGSLPLNYAFTNANGFLTQSSSMLEAPTSGDPVMDVNVTEDLVKSDGSSRRVLTGGPFTNESSLTNVWDITGATDTDRHGAVGVVFIDLSNDPGTEFIEVPLTSEELYVRGAAFVNVDTNGINFHRFYFDYLGGDENRNSRFGLYQNGIQTDTPYFPKTETNVVITLTSLGMPGELVRHDVVLPNWSNPILSKLELKNGSVLESGNPFLSRKMVVLGDSISHGTGQGASYLTYPYIGADLLDVELYNMAVGGGKIAPEVADLLQDFDPVEVIWILVGYNDWQGKSKPLSTITNDYEILLSTVRQHQPDAEVFCSTLTHTTNLDDAESGVTAIEHRAGISAVVNARIAAGDKKLHLVQGDSISDATFLNDAVHFNEPGAAMFASNMGSIVEPILNAVPPVAFPDRERLHSTNTYNVLFLPIDDMRPLIDAYGETDPLQPITPSMDRLADAGVMFLNAHCQQAVCNASRASLLTGLRPDTTMCWKLDTHFRTQVPDVITLPQHFGDHGYNTHGIGKIYHGISSLNQDETLSWKDGWASPQTPYKWYEEAKAMAEDGGNNKVSATDAGELDRGGNPIEDADYNDGNAAALGVLKITEYAEDFHTNGTPFFLAVGFQKPHLPFNCPKAYWDLYNPLDIDLTGYTGIRDMPVGSNKFTAPYGGEPKAFDDVTGTTDNGMPTATEARHLIHGYLACVSFIDTQIGKLLDALEDPDGNPLTDDSVADRTIIVLWGDHGFHLGDHNGFWAKHSNYEISTRVPLIVSTPEMRVLGSEGKRTSALVELVDIYPTLVDLCSLPAPAQPIGQHLQGTTFLPMLEDPAQPWKKAVFSQYQRGIKDTDPGDSPVNNAGTGMGYSIRTERYRYTEWWVTESTDETDRHIIKAGITEPGFVELYDYIADSGERTNMASNVSYSNLVTELSAMLSDPDLVSAGDGWTLSSVVAPETFAVSFTNWQFSYTAPGRNPSDLDSTADPDGDEIENRLEYKFGTHPLEAKDNPVSNYFGIVTLGMTFPDVTNRTDMVLSVDTTTDLTTNLWTGVGITETNTARNGSAIIRDTSISYTAEQQFLRLTIQEP